MREVTQLLVAASQKASDTTVTDTSLRTEDGGGKQGSVSPQPENRHNRDQRYLLEHMYTWTHLQSPKRLNLLNLLPSLPLLFPALPTQTEMLMFFKLTVNISRLPVEVILRSREACRGVDSEVHSFSKLEME